MSNEPTKTLGQRIDEVLEPLYAEAEHHRATIAEVTKQQQALQQQIDAAKQGLGQIESRMAEVVRAMAQKEPVIAAVLGGASASAEAEEAVQSSAEQAQAIEVQDEPEASAEPESAAEPEPIVEAVAEEQVEPSIVLDAQADAQAVEEAAALLAEAPVESQEDAKPDAEAKPASAPAVDLSAAAERAAAAVKLLREKAGTK